MNEISLSVAPMMDWTHSPMRCFMRLICPEAWLYTEMVTSGALVHGNVERHLTFDPIEHPLVLQLGGSDPYELGQAAKIAAEFGYQRLNLNCGCPSPRVQSGAFGACLMEDPQRVRDCVLAMSEVSGLPVSIKHRIGIGWEPRLEALYDFVATAQTAGVTEFIVHARTAILEGLSPKQNRDVPPLDYSVIGQLKAEFPNLKFVLNGGLTDPLSVMAHVQSPNGQMVDGIMIGRAACHDPFIMRRFAQVVQIRATQIQAAQAESIKACTLGDQIKTVHRYLELAHRLNAPLGQCLHPLHGVFRGQHGGKAWRRCLTETAVRYRDDLAAGLNGALHALDSFEANASAYSVSQSDHLPDHSSTHSHQAA